MPVPCDINKIVERLQEASKKPDNEKALASALLNYIEVKKTVPDASLCQFGLPLITKELSESLSKIKTEGVWEDAVCQKAKEYLKEAKEYLEKAKNKNYLKELQEKGTSPHKKCKKKREDAIRILKEFIEMKEASEKPVGHSTYTLYAKAYLLRSQIFRPKGRTIPAKKIEALEEKAIKYVQKAIKQQPDDKDALKVKALCYRSKQFWVKCCHFPYDPQNPISRRYQ